MHATSPVASHSPEAAARYRREGAWRDLTLLDLLRDDLARDPNRPLVIDKDRLLTVADLDDAARRLAGWLAGVGVGAGDVVSFQLPNWHEVFVIDAAVSMLGAISNPIVAIYRDAEVEFILRDAGSKAMFVPETFRSTDYASMMQRLRPKLPQLSQVVVVRGAGGDVAYDAIVGEQRPLSAATRVAADSPRLLLYTSGTTGRAKGVLHSYNTLDCEVRNAARAWGLGAGDAILMPSPLTHITGYLYGIGFSETLGMTSVLMDRWDAGEALRLIDRHGVNGTIAATPFLQELAAAAKTSRNRVPSLRIFACGGAPVPPEIIREATSVFENCAVFRVYGSTEAPTVTLGSPERGSAAAAETEGFIVGHEVKIVDASGAAVEPGQEGEILTRGPEMMLGYIRPEDNADAFDSEGYFRTGDLARIGDDGAVVITGRKKDLIIRGGENLSAKEIEDVLYEHPAIREVAIVAMPHRRLGETVCAFVVLEAGATAPDLGDIGAYLQTRGLARQKIPEHLEVVTELPRTASGKIQKFVLRDRIKRRLTQAGVQALAAH